MGKLVTTSGAELATISTQPADQNPALVYLASLARGSRRTMGQALNTIAGIVASGQDLTGFPWASLRSQHTAAIRAALIDAYTPATANKMLAALKGTLRAAFTLGQMTAEDYQRAIALKAVRGQALPKGRALTAGELRTLFTACYQDQAPAGARDAALLAVLYGAALRRSEAVGLDLADYAPDNGALTVRAGKGHKDRLAYVPQGGRVALAAWLEIRGSTPGALFWPVNKGGTLAPRRLSPAAVYRILERRGTEAGLASFSPHDMRRTSISDLLDAGADIATVQRMAGHANVTTTARYDRRGEEAKRKAADLLHVPYGGK
jgi:site-specific recombinase XerD